MSWVRGKYYRKGDRALQRRIGAYRGIPEGVTKVPFEGTNRPSGSLIDDIAIDTLTPFKYLEVKQALEMLKPWERAFLSDPNSYANKRHEVIRKYIMRRVGCEA